MSRKKQVIFIMTDTQRTDMLGCYGNEYMITPNLDRLATEGIRYDKAYTTQPVCQPARAAIFTGSYPHSCAGWSNCMGLSDNVPNIGQRLSDAGIHTAYVGKWHLDGGDYFGLGRCPKGWDKDYWYDMRCFLEELTPEERYRIRQMESIEKYNITEDMTYGHRCADRAVDFIEKHRDEDYFLVVSLDEPHGPHICPKKYVDLYQDYEIPVKENMKDTLEGKPEHHRIWAGEEYLKACREDFSLKPKEFLGCNTFADYEIGRVIDAAEEQEESPIIIYTSDHGDMLGAHRLFSKNAAIYEEVVNIPLIIKGGERGKVVTAPASHIDIAPTVMEYFELPIPKLLEGKSMLPQIYDTTLKINSEVYTEFTRYEIDHDGFGGLQMMRGIISEEYKLAINLFDKDEFYDLKKDPDEMVNEIDNPEYLDIIKEYHKKMIDHMNDTRDLYRGYQWSLRPWNKDYIPKWDNEGFTRQRENEEYEPRQLDYDTGLPMKEAVRGKYLYGMGAKNDGSKE